MGLHGGADAIFSIKKIEPRENTALGGQCSSITLLRQGPPLALHELCFPVYTYLRSSDAVVYIDQRYEGGGLTRGVDMVALPRAVYVMTHAH